jgi:peptidoglycan/xylan/chitin deacetylase (PgdA/CDA1 family)
LPKRRAWEAAQILRMVQTGLTFGGIWPEQSRSVAGESRQRWVRASISMNRRRFLAYFGIGAAGSLAGGTLAHSRRPNDVPRPRQAREASIGEVMTPTSTGMQRIIWSVDTEEPVAAVTFDDGPDPAFTPRILDLLDRFGVTATFMVMGYNAVQHSDLLRDIAEAGHEIGGHGWKHLNLAETTPQETREEIEHGNRMIEARTGAPVRVFRPPYGRFGEDAVRVLARSGRDLIVWSVTRGMLSWREPEQISSHVLGALGPGDIVDLHDGIGRATFNPRSESAQRIRRRREDELSALPRILEGAKSRGLRLKSVSDLMAAWQSPSTR